MPSGGPEIFMQSIWARPPELHSDVATHHPRQRSIRRVACSRSDLRNAVGENRVRCFSLEAEDRDLRMVECSLEADGVGERYPLLSFARRYDQPQPPAEQPGGQQAVVPANEAVWPLAPAVVNFVHTHALVVKNTGRQAAKNVRINHGWFPPSYQISPPVAHKLEPGQAGSADICIPVLVPGEQVTISYLYFPPIVVGQILGPVKSDEAMAKEIRTIPPPKWLVALLWLLVFVGASTAVYLLLKLLPLVIHSVSAAACAPGLPGGGSAQILPAI